MKEKTYLGDGVYAAFDGYGINLTTENGIQTTNEIHLEPQVLDNLNQFRESLTKRENNDHNQPH